MFNHLVHNNISQLFLLLSLVSLLTTIHAAKRMCSNSNRLAIESCPTDFKNMCAFFSSGICNSSICQKLASNDCAACSDPSVLYYFDEACPGSKTYCDSSMRPIECPESDNPVCGSTREDCSDDSCRKTAVNGCQACQDPTVLFYTPGLCAVPEDTRVLQPKLECEQFDFATGCSESETKPVCAFFTENCDREICSTTVLSSCDACLDPSVLYYQEGECQEEADQRKYCLPINRESDCPQDNEPVCGISTMDCEGDSCAKKFNNGCGACLDMTVSYYLPGDCINLVNDTTLNHLVGEDRVVQADPCVDCIKEEDGGNLVLSEEEFLLSGDD